MEISGDDSLSNTITLQSHTPRETDHPSIQRALDEILTNEEDGLMFSSHVSHTSAVE